MTKQVGTLGPGYEETHTALNSPKEMAPNETADGNRSTKGVDRARWLFRFVVVALLTTNFDLLWEDRTRALDEARIENTNLAHTVSEVLEASIAEVDRLLDALVYELERSALSPSAMTSMQPILVNHVAKTEQIQGLFLYDATGTWLATSVANWSTRRNNSDRPYFAHHRDNLSGMVLVSQPIVSRSTGKWVLPHGLGASLAPRLGSSRHRRCRGAVRVDPCMTALLPRSPQDY